MRTLDPATEAGATALHRLETELMAWMTTTDPDGQPQSSPIWFQWTGDEVLIYSGKRAPRNGNVPDRPLVAFNLNTDAVVAYLRTRPGADVLWTSCGRGEGSPQPFYEQYGFVPTGEIKWDETVLRLDLT